MPFRGKRNEPAYVREVTQELARIRNLPAEEFARQVLGNFERFLNIPK
jgi:TatD DNase family protein